MSGTIEACPNDFITVRWSWANRGTEPILSDRPSKVNFVLSIDDYISNHDHLIGTDSVSGARGAFGPIESSAQIPKLIPTGREYFLGVVVDPQNEISEYYENNNATYLGAKVEILSRAECDPVPPPPPVMPKVRSIESLLKAIRLMFQDLGRGTIRRML
jgi:hypothetical protein